jgi:O-antigen/teichoic acid export membrane protein
LTGRRDTLIGIVGLGLSGIAAYLFLVIAAQALGAARFAALGTLWSVVFLATAALAAPLEIELARRVGAARGSGESPADAVRGALGLAAGLGGAAVALAIVGGPWLDRALFGGQPGYSIAGGVAFAGLLMGGAIKGACAGSGRLAGWGAFLFVDGGSRSLLALLTALVAPSPLGFAAALAVGPWLALAAVGPLIVPLAFGPRGPVRRGALTLVGGTSPLVIGAVASSVLTYLGAVMLPLLVPGPDARVGAYVAALALARLPLFAVSPLVAMVVPRIACAVAAGQTSAAARTAGLFIGLSLLGGLAVVGAAVTAGSGALALLFGREFGVPTGSLMAIAVAAGAWVVATVAGAAGVGAGRARLVAGAWCLGLVVAVVTAVTAVGDAFVRTDHTIVAGAVAAAIAAVAVAAIPLGSTRVPVAAR